MLSPEFCLYCYQNPPWLKEREAWKAKEEAWKAKLEKRDKIIREQDEKIKKWKEINWKLRKKRGNYE